MWKSTQYNIVYARRTDNTQTDLLDGSPSSSILSRWTKQPGTVCSCRLSLSSCTRYSGELVLSAAPCRIVSIILPAADAVAWQLELTETRVTTLTARRYRSLESTPRHRTADAVTLMGWPTDNARRPSITVVTPLAYTSASFPTNATSPC